MEFELSEEQNKVIEALKDKNNVIIITPSDLSYVISKIKVDELPNINFTFNTVYNEKGVILIVDKELLALISLYNLFKYE